MKEIMVVQDKLEKEAKVFSEFRSKVKQYLTKYDACYDKFTITDMDTFLGYVSEAAIMEYLKKNYGDKIDVKTWADNFDIERISSAVKADNSNPEEIEYAKKYFYDKYDIEIVDKKTGKSLHVDVKTAATRNYPEKYWDFLYPVVQNQKDGKDCVVLCYYYQTNEKNKIILIGYISEADISKCNILKKGAKTKFGTINQIDNYETGISKYKDLSNMLNVYLGL